MKNLETNYYTDYELLKIVQNCKSEKELEQLAKALGYLILRGESINANLSAVFIDKRLKEII